MMVYPIKYLTVMKKSSIINVLKTIGAAANDISPLQGIRKYSE